LATCLHETTTSPIGGGSTSSSASGTGASAAGECGTSGVAARAGARREPRTMAAAAAASMPATIQSSSSPHTLTIARTPHTTTNAASAAQGRARSRAWMPAGAVATSTARMAPRKMAFHESSP
jgi:hypothetical protein